MYIRQLSIFLQNTSGRLLPAAEALRDAGIDIRALSVSDTKDFGILRMIVTDVDKACSVLKELGCSLAITEVVGVSIADRPGGLAEVVSVLADSNINIEYMYAFVGREGTNAFVIFRFEDNDAATDALTKAGIRIITEESVIC